MMHSYEGLDRSGGFSRVLVFAPLRNREFRILWSGMCMSLIGDGVFMVALAWQAYALSNSPEAMAVVGIAMTVPTIVCLLIGGVVSDRVDRRRVMLAADSLRALALAVLAALALSKALTLPGLIGLAALYGAATAFFDPAFDAIVPQVLRGEALAQAIESWPEDARVAVVASGGLSHFVVDEELDHMVLRGLQEKDEATLSSVPRHQLYSAASESLNWVTLGGVFQKLPHKFNLVDYVPVYRTPAMTGGGWAFGIWR